MNMHVPSPAPERRPIAVRLATPRGFCAGVDRAIQIVERAIEKFGAPVYVRHEIVHNRHVVERLKAMGAVFVKELDECPDDRPVVFSAHGVPKSVPAAARSRDLLFLDATCPLVSKVHVEAERHHAAGRHIILIGRPAPSAWSRPKPTPKPSNGPATPPWPMRPRPPCRWTTRPAY